MNTLSFQKKAFLVISSEVNQIWERREAWSGSYRDFNTMQRQRRTHFKKSIKFESSSVIEFEQYHMYKSTDMSNIHTT